jgi:hypothetical protein
VKLLDRYVLRSFLEPFIMCTLGFLAIWLIFDLSDNANDFIQGKASMKALAGFYLIQLPSIVIIVLPVGLLLALLFSLSKMSRTNELIAQLTAGRSVFRILVPLLIIGFICTGILAYLNYELAPHADSVKKMALEQIQKGKKKAERDALEAHLFRDRPGPPNIAQLVHSQDADGFGHVERYRHRAAGRAREDCAEVVRRSRRLDTRHRHLDFQTRHVR